MEAKTPVHTIVLHRLPDLEALYMVWLVATFTRLRKWLGVEDDFLVKFIPSGLLQKDDWIEEIRRQDDAVPSVLRSVGRGRVVSLDALQGRGYLFLDCGRGGPFDQHVAAVNRGRAQDEVASVDLLMQMSGLPDHEPSVLPFLRVVSDNDRTGNSVCRQPPFDKRCDTPHVPRDLRTMITTLNELYPDHPQVVMEAFFLAMSGLEHRFLALHDEWETAGGTVPDETAIDLREMNFLTVDNAALGLPGYLETLESYRGKSELIVAKVAWFWQQVQMAWAQRERDWRQGVKDHGHQTTKRFEAVYRPRTSDGNSDGEDRGEKRIKVTMGFSVSHQFPTVARTQGADLVVQLYEEGRLMVTRRGTKVGLNHIARMLRYADACKRRGTIVVPRDWGARNTVSVVELRDRRRVSTFFFAGFVFGNYFRSNREGQVLTVLNPQEIVDTVLAALMDEPFETVDRILGFRPQQERDRSGDRREGRR